MKATDDGGGRQVTALELLRAQHEEVRDIFEEIADERDGEEKLELVQELSDNLAAHATIEERIFYPAAFASRTEELLREAVEEHLAMKRIVADLLELTPSDETFDAKVSVLREQVEHHVMEEEGELFPAVERELGQEELSRLGAEMKALFEEEMRGTPREEVPEQTRAAAPLRRAHS